VIFDVGYDDLRAALRRTDGSTMSTSMGMEVTSFSEQAPAARRDYFAALGDR
jgi:hypothetical protein